MQGALGKQAVIAAGTAWVLSLSCASHPSSPASANRPQHEIASRRTFGAGTDSRVTREVAAVQSANPKSTSASPEPSSAPRSSVGEKPKAEKLTSLPTTLPDPCGPRESPEQAHRDLLEANEWIARAGEHPMLDDLLEIIPRLQRAAYAGDVQAQVRFGLYVVSHWFTDEMFWPQDRAVAISALAMLRVAARKRAAEFKNAKVTDLDAIMADLSRDPVSISKVGGDAPLPKAWVSAALIEAKRWENCPTEASDATGGSAAASAPACPALGERNFSTTDVERASGVKRGWTKKRVLSVAGKPTECHEDSWYYIAGQYSGPEVTITVTFKSGIVTQVSRSAIACRYYDLSK